MATATVQTITAKLKKMGMSDSENTKGYFKAPKSAAGKEFVVYLSDKYNKKDRPDFLQGILSTALKEFNPKYVKPGSAAKSTAGHLGFTGTQIYIVAKLVAAKGGGENKGIQFEKELMQDLIDIKSGRSAKRYKDFSEWFEETILKGDDIIRVEPTGSENTPRPLKVDGSNNLYVSVRAGARTAKIGSSLADIVVHTKKGKKHNLSLKYGSTVTFFNSGVGKIFNEDDFKKGKFEDPTAAAIIDLFDIDPIKFRNVFMNYKAKDPFAKKEKSEKNVEKIKINKNKMKNFIMTVIGYDYILVHKNSDGSVDSYRMTEAALEKAATPLSSTVDIYYPRGGSAKRIDIKLETEMFELNFNIRNKQGGILPSHIMCDYKIKH
jgi:CRISPR/Cas system CSM-associated protein Csm2 small subunit